MEHTEEEYEEIEIQHREIIEEEDIDLSDLPTEVKIAMRKFNSKLKKYEESGDPDLFLELQQDDIAIADAITTWLEDTEIDDDDDDEEEDEEEEEEDEDEDEERGGQGSHKQKSQKSSDSTPPAQVAPAIASEAAPAANVGNEKSVTDLEEKVRHSMNGNVISVEQLEKIIGREPDYPTHRVGNLILTKQYLRPFYQVG